MNILEPNTLPVTVYRGGNGEDGFVRSKEIEGRGFLLSFVQDVDTTFAVVHNSEGDLIERPLILVRLGHHIEEGDAANE